MSSCTAAPEEVEWALLLCCVVGLLQLPSECLWKLTDDGTM